MATTTFSGPVVSENGFVGTTTGNTVGTHTGNVNAGSGYLVIRSATAAQIADASNTINSSGKYTGSLVLDTTNGRVMVALGGELDSDWAVADGSATVTPTA
jgi:hypothetical protein